MKKASDIILIINGVLSILAALMFLAFGIVGIVFSTPAFTQMFVDGIKNGTIHSTIQGTPEEIARLLQIGMLVMGCIFLPEFLLAVANATLNFVAKNKHSFTLYILVIIFSLLTGTWIGVVGGILGAVKE